MVLIPILSIVEDWDSFFFKRAGMGIPLSNCQYFVINSNNIYEFSLDLFARFAIIQPDLRKRFSKNFIKKKGIRKGGK